MPSHKSVTITQGTLGSNTWLIWSHQSPNAKITQAQLITDFIQIFLYSVRAVQDTMYRFHLTHNNGVITITDGDDAPMLHW